MFISPGIPSMGDPHAPAVPEDDDLPEDDLEAARVFAQKINASEPGWFVMYGVASRCYWAFPLWDPGEPMVLERPTPDRLLVAMREAEARHRGQAVAE